MEDIDGKNVSIPVIEYGNIILEEMEHQRGINKDKYDEWVDLIDKVNPPR